MHLTKVFQLLVPASPRNLKGWSLLNDEILKTLKKKKQKKTCYYLSSTYISLTAQMVNNLPAMQETWALSLGREDPLEKGMATHSSILPGEFHGQRSLVGYSSRGHEELDTTQQLNIHISFIFLGGGNVLAWLPSM